jgi:ubiquitin-activating enzyme E1 C
MEVGRWEDIEKLINREGPFNCPGFVPDNPDEGRTKVKTFISEDVRILVIGAGGLGCELLKDLALLGFRNIDVIDMDTIDVTNLNRQFLFTPNDIGRPKAEVAAEFINRRVPGVNVIPHFCKIQDKPLDFYSEFNIIVAGLDSIVARRWINCTLVTTVRRSGGSDENPEWDQETIIPLIDGGTEGFKGQARVILPRITPCFECLLELFPKDPLNFPICTIANTPRQPEHCIQYVYLIQWEKERPEEKVDGDDPNHIQWIYERSVARAKEFNISGVTYKLTQGVVKHIIPAIASTNAIISAACATEAFKIATQSNMYLKNYMMYSGTEGIYTSTLNYDKNIDCSVCGTAMRSLHVKEDITVEGVLEELLNDTKLQLSKPSISSVVDDKTVVIYIQSPPQLEKQTKVNLPRKLIEFSSNQNTIDLDVMDPSLPQPIQMQIYFDKMD